MKKTPERIELLAAEYVLGSLQGPARRRFEAWMMESRQVREEVWFWEARLSGLADSVPPVPAPERVWTAINDRLWPQTDTWATPEPVRRSGWNLSWLWPSWSVLATAAVLVMAVLWVQTPEPTGYPGLSGAIVQENVADPLWLVSDDVRDNRLRLRSVAAQAAEANRDYELWVVPTEGAPRSLGVITAEDRTLQIELSEELRASLDASRTLAISLEPTGGSPTGVPTGPILHVVTLYEI